MNKIWKILPIIALLALCLLIFCSCCEHSYTETTVDATCTVGAHILKTCEKCGEEERVFTGEALGHTFGAGADCESRVCLTCAAVVAPVAEHSYADEVKAPTCLVGGYTTHRCTECGDVYSDAPTPATGHDYDNDSPCVLRSCKNCDHAILPGHDDVLINEVTKPTIATPGYGMYECQSCHRKEGRTLPCVVATDLGLPVISLTGSMAGMTKEVEKTLSFQYESENLNFSCTATLKIQGASSAGYPKKNYSVSLYTDETLVKKYNIDPFGWGKENKYCLKANYVDFSQARNVVGGRLYGQISATRDNINPGLLNAPNYGAIDGYPVIVYHDGSFLGLYTLNIPKDNWMFGIKRDSTLRQAIVFCINWGDSGRLKEHMAYDLSNGWNLDYCSTEDTRWMVDSFNNMMDFVNGNNGSAFRAGIHKYIDVEAAIDSMIYTYVIAARDNFSKNILWVTYDGVQWIPSVYDMDGVFGLWWDGKKYNNVSDMTPRLRSDNTIDDGVENNLWQKLFDNYRTEIRQRYTELRQTVLTRQNISDTFDEFFALIPDVLYESEKIRWPDVPSHDTNNKSQIMSYTMDRLAYLDNFVYKL